ncbi:hypothetical protein TVAG_195760 [Trichomonas vaginalis G3]|uniref:Uncharacterized protein n=1 Tax=Trichomonas vaginalis (strain ATCC PRA-98 / G3) TaxID=412133 RepID=A2ETL5_TRIV3|nr:hypothetical protein TVAGG3_0403970 [Trichomonas vaginalis G3]EAY03983.1 hypothetical protein TVAG_195760 [Trichomonas vaginalis G3]KAI5534897.1 hypothetical protein TVAGG3_0403970 [Trichomonas vaginalis G3]|eukprot:XP_001316206.1 hypothetical protein [Trichomonas vaginalis G3]
MFAFFVCFNAANPVSKVGFRDVSDMDDTTDQIGYYDIDYRLDGVGIPFSLLNIGTEFKLVVDGKTYYPKQYERGPFGGLDIELYMDKITEDDFAVHYRITNKGKKAARFQLGTFTDVSFRDMVNGDINNIKVLNDKRIFYVYCSDLVKNPWQKLVFDQRPPDSDRLQYIPPNHHWFGLLPDNADKYNMRFKSDADNKDFADPEGQYQDISVSHSWDEIEIGVDETVVLGNRIYFLMKTPFEINPEKKVIYSEPQNNIALPTWIRILEYGKKYHPQIKLHSQPESGWRDDRGLSFTCRNNYENWKFRVNHPQQGEFVYDLRLVQENPRLVSNVETVTLKVSTKPHLGIAPIDHEVTKVYKNDDSIKFKATIRGDSTINLKYVVIKIGKNNVRIKEFEKLSEPFNLEGQGLSDQNFEAEFSLQEAHLRSGDYKLEITAINSHGLSSDTKTIEFKTNYATKIIKYEFKPKSVVTPGSNVELVGTFLEEDIQQVIKFHLDLKDGQAKHDSDPYQAKGREQ